MKQETAIILSIGIIDITLTSYAYVKKKPYITSAIMGSLGAFGLINALITNQEVSQMRARLG